jgi:hypothetical protein
MQQKAKNDQGGLLLKKSTMNAKPLLAKPYQPLEQLKRIIVMGKLG